MAENDIIARASYVSTKKKGKKKLHVFFSSRNLQNRSVYSFLWS